MAASYGPSFASSSNAVLPRQQQVYPQTSNMAHTTTRQMPNKVSPPPDNVSLSAWTENDCVGFVRGVVEKVIPIRLTDTDDLFNIGSCDSIQATYIHNVIYQLLRASQSTSSSPSDFYASSGSSTPISRVAGRSRLPQPTHNFVYSNPSVQKLGNYLYQVVNYGHSSVALSLLSGKISDMENLVEKYSNAFPIHQPSRRRCPTQGEGEVVLITGTTGSLGSHLLEALIKDPAVAKVYALNRSDASGARSLYIRQSASFRERALDFAALNSTKLEMIECDHYADQLGLEDEEMYQEILGSVTQIVCCAWDTNPNHSLATMEPLIAGLRRLIDLALHSPRPTPPRLLFISSLAVFSNWTPTQPAPELLNTRPVTAVGTGYSESKWVAESILHRAGERTALQPTVVRFGQISSAQNGAWSPKDWFPTLVRSGLILRCLPLPMGYLSWIPARQAAALAMEVQQRAARRPPGHGCIFVNALHPNPTPASTIFQALSEFLNLPVVPYEQWLHALESSAHPHLNSSADPVKAAITNPALILLDFYRSIGRPVSRADGSSPGSGSDSPVNVDMEAFGGLTAETSQARQAAPRVLQELAGRRISKEDVERWLLYWKKVGYLSASPRTR